MQEVTIVGGGLVGSLMALMLAKNGYAVALYERRDDMRKNTVEAGRSINMACSYRGWSALKSAGLEDKIRKEAIAMYGRTMHSVTGELSYQSYGLEDQAIYSISRGDLNKILLQACEDSGVKINFNHKCIALEDKIGMVCFENGQGDEVKVKADFVLGADGVFSAVRYELQKNTYFDLQQQYISHDYKELVLPSGENGAFLLSQNALHIWPRDSFMLIALPNPDGSFTCTLFLPREGKNSFEWINNNGGAQLFFENQFPDVLEYFPDIISQFSDHQTSALAYVKCFPWNSGKTLLIGDAAHGIVPFYGQGMNAGFEDCELLMNALKENPLDTEAVFKAFALSRKADADAICDLALKNFVEMRDLVGDARFLQKKKIERLLDECFSEYQGEYTMVSFSSVPYAKALRQGQIQYQLLEELVENDQVIENLANKEKFMALTKPILIKYGYDLVRS